MHESFESPGAIEVWAKNKGHEISYTKLYEGNSFPERCDFDFLFVMGGPQSPATTMEECPHFDAKKEMIRREMKKSCLIFMTINFNCL